MIYTEATKKALKIMFKSHKNQVDIANTPYVFHPFHIAEQMKDENRVTTALLHDVLEDTNLTIEDLRKEGFKEEVLAALVLLTHEKNEDYLDYIKKIAPNPIAKDVKLADLHHNSDLNRLEEITDKDLKRIEIYKKAIDYLESQ